MKMQGNFNRGMTKMRETSTRQLGWWRLEGAAKDSKVGHEGRKLGEQAGTQGVTDIGAGPAPNHKSSQSRVLP